MTNRDRQLFEMNEGRLRISEKPPQIKIKVVSLWTKIKNLFN